MWVRYAGTEPCKHHSFSDEEFRGTYSWQLSYGRFGITAGLWASLMNLPVLPAIEGTQSLVRMSAWGCIRKLRPRESQPYERHIWGSLAASQLLSSNACSKDILPSTFNSNKVWLKTCSDCTLSDARYLILSSLRSFAVWSKRDLDLFQTFTVETCSMAWSHWAREKNKKRLLEVWSSSFWQKNSWFFAWFSKLFHCRSSYPLLQHQEIPIFALKLLQGLIWWYCFFSESTELKTPVMMNSHLSPSLFSSLPLSQRHFLALVFA